MKRGQHKLADHQVLQIFADKRSGTRVAKLHKISPQMVSKIRRGQAYMELTKMPTWREGITVKLIHQGITFHITVGIVNRRVLEVFCSNPMKGSDLEALLTDGCILVSLLLQGGYQLDDLVVKLGEVRPESGQPGPPASIIGAVVRAAQQLDKELLDG